MYHSIILHGKQTPDCYNPKSKRKEKLKSIILCFFLIKNNSSGLCHMQHQKQVILETPTCMMKDDILFHACIFYDNFRGDSYNIDNIITDKAIKAHDMHMQPPACI